MRQEYNKILKEHFHKHLITKRYEMKLSQVKMADKLAMDTRSYVNLDHGKVGCSGLTLALYLIYCCENPVEYLEELKNSLENDEGESA